MQDARKRVARAGLMPPRWMGGRAGVLGLYGLSIALSVFAPLHAQTSLSEQEQRARAQRDAQQREQLRSAPDVRLQAPHATDYRQSALPVETPCFKIASLHLDGPRQADVAFAQRYLDGYAGRCVGQQGLELVQHRLADLILARGYVTTRVVIPEQNLAGGSLHLTLVPGTLGAVRYAPGSATVNWQSAFPLRPGDLLNLRAIEQGLEQLKRVPSQDVKIDIAPGAVPGTSDLVLTVTRGKFWRYTLNEDDSGADATGKEQGGISLALDQPLGINDLLTLGVTHQVGRYHGNKGTHGSNFSYSVPWDNWTFNLASYHYGYHQLVTGSQQSFRFTGSSPTQTISANRLIQRDAVSKTSVQLTVSARHADSRIDGVEIQTQHRQTRSAELALIHRRYIGAAQLDIRLAYRHGVPWFGGQWKAGSNGGPTFRYGITTLDASLGLPLQVLGQRWLWTSEWHAQATGDHLYIEDYLSIGGRYTVRGFDGNETLGGDHGAYWRNTLAWPLLNTGASLYGGIDVGRAGGDATTSLPSHSLSGTVLGLRGGRWGLNWDVFMGWPLQAPRGFHTRRPTAGMQWIYSF